jgi:hypothetical protein
MDPTQPNVLLTKEKLLMAKSWTTYYSHIVKIELTNYTLFCQKKDTSIHYLLIDMDIYLLVQTNYEES